MDYKWEQTMQRSQSTATPLVIGSLKGNGILALCVVDVFDELP